MPVEQVVVGDALVVRAGEVVPVDGVVESSEAVVDESTLTGEPLPVAARARRPRPQRHRNAGDVFELRAVRPAAESAYAAVVRLVQDAESQKAPFVRLADRYAIFFLPLTDPWSRVWPGRSRAIRCAHSRCSSSRRRAR